MKNETKNESLMEEIARVNDPKNNWIMPEYDPTNRRHVELLADGETQREIVELRTLVGNLTDVLAKLIRDFNQQRVEDTTILDKTLASLETTALPRKEISISKSVVKMLSSDY